MNVLFPNWLDFERRIHVEIMTSIRRGNFDVDSTFKIDEILMSSPRGFFYLFSTSNRRNCSTHCFHSILTFSALRTYSKLIWYSAKLLTKSLILELLYILGILQQRKWLSIQKNFIFFKITLTKIINANIYMTARGLEHCACFEQGVPWHSGNYRV